MRLDACESDGERTAYPQRAHGDFEQVLGMIDQPVERQGLTQRAQRVGQNRYMGFVFERSQAFLLVGWLVGWHQPRVSSGTTSTLAKGIGRRVGTSSTSSEKSNRWLHSRGRRAVLTSISG